MKSVKCPECGFVGWADAEHCKKCGVARTPDLTGDSPEFPQSYQAYQYATGGYSQRKLKKGLATASLVIGILDFFTLGMLGVGVVAGIMLAVVALNKAKQNPMEYGGQGLAVAGLVTSIVSAFIIVPIGIVAAIAIPNLLASRRAANEGSSIRALRTIHSAQMTYQATRGNGAFGTLEQLGTDGLITQDLANGLRNGYRFTVEIRSARSNESAGFQAVGVPLTYGDTGIRSFYIDETGVIRGGDNRGAVATELDDPLNANGYSSSSPPRNYNYDSRDY
jgi:type II secretory pathway pseudopilin PulG